MSNEKRVTIKEINDWAFGRADPEMTRRLDELRNDPDSAVSRYCNRMAGKTFSEGPDLPSRRYGVFLFSNYRRPFAIAAGILILASLAYGGRRLVSSWQAQRNIEAANWQIQQSLNASKEADELFALSTLIEDQSVSQSPNPLPTATFRSVLEGQTARSRQILVTIGEDPKLELSKAKVLSAQARFHFLLGGKDNYRTALDDLNRAVTIYDKSISSSNNSLRADAARDIMRVAPSLFSILSPQLGGRTLPIAERADIDRLTASFSKVVSLFGDDPATIEAKANALENLARLRHMLGKEADDKAAIAYLDQAMAIYVKMPSSIDQIAKLTQASLLGVTILGPREDFDSCLTRLRSAMEALSSESSELDINQKNHEAIQLIWSRLYSSRATVNRAQSRKLQKEDPKKNAKLITKLLNDSTSDYKNAIEVVEKLVHGGQVDAKTLEWQSRLYGNYGLFLFDLADSIKSQFAIDALNYFSDAVKIADYLVRQPAISLSAFDTQAAAVANEGYGQLTVQNFIAAKESLLRATSLYDKLHLQNPDIREFAWGQAYGRLLSGMAIFALQDPDPKKQADQKKEAIKLLKEANTEYEQLNNEYRGVSEISNELAELKQFIKSNNINIQNIDNL